LLEGLVFATRIAAALHREPPSPGDPMPLDDPAALIDPGARADLQRAMTDGAGVLRSADSLAATEKALSAVGERRCSVAGPEAWETTNLLTVAAALVAAADRRTETRGSHWREDFPLRDDGHWHLRLRSRIGASGDIELEPELLP
jgi:L-aspartate oxidase